MGEDNKSQKLTHQESFYNIRQELDKRRPNMLKPQASVPLTTMMAEATRQRSPPNQILGPLGAIRFSSDPNRSMANSAMKN